MYEKPILFIKPKKLADDVDDVNEITGRWLLRSTNAAFPVTDQDYFPEFVKHIFNKSNHNVCMLEKFRPCKEHSDCSIDLDKKATIDIYVQSDDVRRESPSSSRRRENELQMRIKKSGDIVLWPKTEITYENVKLDLFVVSYQENLDYLHRPVFIRDSLVFTFYTSNNWKSYDQLSHQLILNSQEFFKIKHDENSNRYDVHAASAVDDKEDMMMMMYTSNPFDLVQTIMPQKDERVHEMTAKKFSYVFSLINNDDKGEDDAFFKALEDVPKTPIVTSFSNPDAISRRLGTYVSKMSREEIDNEKINVCYLIRCSTLAPTVYDDDVMSFTKRLDAHVKKYFNRKDEEIFNHALVQTYIKEENNTSTAVGTISWHSDKTMDMPSKEFFMAFFSGYSGIIDCFKVEQQKSPFEDACRMIYLLNAISLLIFREKSNEKEYKKFYSKATNRIERCAGVRQYAFVCLPKSALIVTDKWNSLYEHTTMTINPRLSLVRTSAVFRQAIACRYRRRQGEPYLLFNKETRESKHLSKCEQNDKIYSLFQKFYKDENNMQTRPKYSPHLFWFTENFYDLE